jgi:hypothetical protein
MISGFGKVRNIICRVVRDNIKDNNIIETKEWERIQNAASLIDNNEWFQDNILRLSNKHKIHSCCNRTFLNQKFLNKEITKKITNILEDLFNENSNTDFHN